jgi:hypothetical protein
MSSCTLMSSNDRKVLGFLVILVIGIAVLRGGVLLLLGVIFGGLLFFSKWLWLLALKAFGDDPPSFFSYFTGARPYKRRRRRPPGDR